MFVLISSPLRSKEELLESPRRPRLRPRPNYVQVSLYSKTILGIFTKLGRIVYGHNAHHFELNIDDLDL